LALCKKLYKSRHKCIAESRRRLFRPRDEAPAGRVCVKKGKDAMRRLSVLVVSLGILNAVVGCCSHYAGVCDCDRDPRGCERYTAGSNTIVGRCGSPVLTPIPVAAPVPGTVIDAPKPLPAPAR
jgi:hypothetical protein